MKHAHQRATAADRRDRHQLPRRQHRRRNGRVRLRRDRGRDRRAPAEAAERRQGSAVRTRAGPAAEEARGLRPAAVHQGLPPRSRDWADVHFICVGTPQTRGQRRRRPVPGELGRRHARAAADPADAWWSAAPPSRSVRRSWSSSGSTPRPRPATAIEIAWQPEFLREAHGVEDTLHPDRLVFGVQTRGGGGQDARGVRHPDRRGYAGGRLQPAHRGAGEGRRERLPGHEDLVHQRARRDGRRDRRGRHPAGRRARATTSGSAAAC